MRRVLHALCCRRSQLLLAAVVAGEQHHQQKQQLASKYDITVLFLCFVLYDMSAEEISLLESVDVSIAGEGGVTVVGCLLYTSDAADE